MKVGWLGSFFWKCMDIDIKYVLGQGINALKPTFLICFSKRCEKRVFNSLAMTTQLNPNAKLSVMREKDFVALLV